MTSTVTGFDTRCFPALTETVNRMADEIPDDARKVLLLAAWGRFVFGIDDRLASGEMDALDIWLTLSEATLFWALVHEDLGAVLRIIEPA
jgi:hypothetical protein